MNKLIKSAMMMASVGAMLCFVGCGEQDPKLEAAKTCREINMVMTDAGFEAIIPNEGIVGLENGTLKDADLKEALAFATKNKAILGTFKKYVAVVKELESLDSNCYKRWHFLKNPKEFLDAGPSGQSEALQAAEKQLNLLKTVMGK